MARILLIEDNRDHLELMAYLLGAHGHVMLSAGSAESGRTMMRCCEEIDLIICDIKLGNASGIDLVRSLRNSGRFSGVPIVAVTAGSVGQAPDAFAAGFNRYMLKPIDPETFVAEINGCLPSRCIRPPSPRVATTSASALPAPLARDDGPQPTILAVDDRLPNLDLICALLRPLGYRVLTAHSVEGAITRARRDEPHLVVTDVHMGDGTGFDLIRALQRDPTLQHIPWLVTSATYLSVDARAQELGLDDSNFILQPWEPHALVCKVRNRLRQNRKWSARETREER